MAAKGEFAQHVLDQLQPAGAVTHKAMFGGFGFWERGAMFALIDSGGTLYFKVDEASRPRYQAAGSGPFAPHMPKGRPGMTMPYYAVPAEVLDDSEELVVWARQAIAVAHTPKVKAKAAPAPKAKAEPKARAPAARKPKAKAKKAR